MRNLDRKIWIIIFYFMSSIGVAVFFYTLFLDIEYLVPVITGCASGGLTAVWMIRSVEGHDDSIEWTVVSALVCTGSFLVNYYLGFTLNKILALTGLFTVGYFCVSINEIVLQNEGTNNST